MIEMPPLQEINADSGKQKAKRNAKDQALQMRVRSAFDFGCND